MELTSEQIGRALSAARDLDTRFVKPFRDLRELTEVFAQIASDLPRKQAELAKTELAIETATHRLQQVERESAARIAALEQQFAQTQKETAEAMEIITKPLADARKDLASIQDAIKAKHAIGEREWAGRQRDLQKAHETRMLELNRDIVGLQNMKRDLEVALANLKAKFS